LSLDPVLGRVGAPQSWNRFAYVRGNPVKLVDPDGRDAVALCIGAGCVVAVRAQIIANSNDLEQVSTAWSFKVHAEAYWNKLSVTTHKGIAITFDVQLNVVEANDARPNTDTLTVVQGAGRSHVNRIMRRGASLPDSGELFTQDNSGNPSGWSGIAPHEVGHLMGLPDLYVPGVAHPVQTGSDFDIMESAQPDNSAPSAQFAISPANLNSHVINPFDLLRFRP
jgi:hypothetical protein